MRDFPILKSQDKDCGQAQASGSSDAPKKNRFYALRSRGEKDISLNVLIGRLKVFSLDVYALLDPCATLLFVTPLAAKKFDISHDILYKYFIVSTPVVSRLFQKGCIKIVQ